MHSAVSGCLEGVFVFCATEKAKGMMYSSKGEHIIPYLNDLHRDDRALESLIFVVSSIIHLTRSHHALDVSYIINMHRGDFLQVDTKVDPDADMHYHPMDVTK
jgi:hypothetical protein